MRIRNPHGIIAWGEILTAPYEDTHWDPTAGSPTALYVDIRFEHLIDPASEPGAILTQEMLRSRLPQPHHWHPRASGVRLPDDVAARVELLWVESLNAHYERPQPVDCDLRPGLICDRGALHDQYGGQRQGGISTPRRFPIVLLFTGETGHQDSWTDSGVFNYTGEGQRGDMAFTRGNRALRDHERDGKDLHLFAYQPDGQAKYIGQMLYIGHHLETRPDLDGRPRQAIIFELAPIDQAPPAAPTPLPQADELWQADLAQLWQRALAAARPDAPLAERLAHVRARSDTIRVYALKRANGACEGCGNPAPFLTAGGRPYLEVHHLRRLSDGGPDHPEHVAALCPNCHRRAHYGQDSVDLAERLKAAVGQKESHHQPTRPADPQTPNRRT